jgi:hypothetical protein
MAAYSVFFIGIKRLEIKNYCFSLTEAAYVPPCLKPKSIPIPSGKIKSSKQQNSSQTG